MYAKLYLGLKVGATILSLGLVASMFVTNPSEVGPYGITLWFTGLLLVATVFGGSLHYRLRGRHREGGWFDSFRLGFLGSTWAVGLLALASLRQLTLRDIILVAVLVVVVNFFMKRMQV